MIYFLGSHQAQAIAIFGIDSEYNGTFCELYVCSEYVHCMKWWLFLYDRREEREEKGMIMFFLVTSRPIR